MNLEIGLHLKVFLKNRLLVVIYMMMYISTLIPLTFFIVMGASFSYIFYIICRFIFYETVLFMIMSYVFLISDRMNHISEVIQSMIHERRIYLKSCIVVLLLLLAFYNIFLIGILFVTLMKNNEFQYFSNIYVISFLMNIILPQLVCFMITVMVSMMNNDKLASLLLILSMLLMSPFMNVLEWQSEPFIPVDKLVNVIWLPFSVFMQHSEYSIDSLYGYQNEVYKIWILVLWAVVFIIIYNIRYLRRRKQYCMIPVLIIGLCSYQIYKPQSIYRIDYKWDDTYSDYNYYEVSNDVKSYSNNTVDYKISEYDLNISITDKLYVDASLHIDSDKPIDKITLTLYHNYRISNMTADNIKSYSQDGDYITIEFNDTIIEADINISYSGYHSTLFSNYQAAELPGYFPWYPVAGEKSVYFNNNEIAEINYGLNPYNRIDEAEFNVTVDARYDIICNLEEISHNVYSGNSDSLTIIGGNIEKQEEQIVNYYPLSLSYYYTVDDYNSEIYGYIEDTKNTFYDIFENTITDFDNKMIIVGSKALKRTQVSGEFAVFNDYVMMSEGYFDTQSYIKYKLFNRFDLNPMLIQSLITLDYSALNQDSMVDSLLVEINYYYSMSKDSSFEEDKIITEECEALIDEMNDYIDVYGKEALAKQLGKVILGGDYEIGN
ncbi:MAG: hypothetical protein LUH02_06680 [Erysipelotrichaceae bacterium]|nr:hypothetical protein [Erysipelotrichaceae bacterium]